MSLRAEGVTVQRGGRRILEDVHLEAHPGELLALIGPNGAGKSTLLEVLAGELRPDAGTVTLDGDVLHTLRPLPRSRRRAVLAQSPAVSFSFTAREVIALGRTPWARTSEELDDEHAIHDAVQRTDVSDLLDRAFPTLSGGERARVSFARVLAQNTPLVLLDEPTAALDLRHQEDVLCTAADLAARGRTVIVVLHDLSLAGAYADRVALLHDGRLVRVAPPKEVLTVDTISDVYGVPVEIVERRAGLLVLPRRQRVGA